MHLSCKYPTLKYEYNSLSCFAVEHTKFSIKCKISIYNPKPICSTAISVFAIHVSAVNSHRPLQYIIVLVNSMRMYFYICVFSILGYKRIPPIAIGYFSVSYVQGKHVSYFFSRTPSLHNV